MSANDTGLPAPKERTFLITGCFDGGLGSALAIALHQAGQHVYATARSSAKLAEVEAHGIETLKLDVLSSDSIATAASHICHLDVLVNNAGALYSMPVTDMSLSRARELFDLNVRSYLEVTQAFLPLLLQSKGTVVNQTSTAGLFPIAFQSSYNASKAAIIMFTDCMRMELAPLGIKVVDLKTSNAAANGYRNQAERFMGARLPKGSLYEDARAEVEKTMRGERFPVEVTAKQWAEQGTKELLRNDKPPKNIWGGTKAGLAWFSSLRPFSLPDMIPKKMVGLDLIAPAVSTVART